MQVSRIAAPILIGGALLSIVLLPPAAAQSHLAGTVTQEDTGRPLPNVSLFLAGTLHGTTTDEEGRFALNDLPSGSHTVVASIVGYATKQVVVRLKDTSRVAVPATGSLSFELEQQVIELEGITIEDSREEWLDHLEKFRAAFIGDGPNAEHCEFLNPEVLSFEEREGRLLAHTRRPLRVRNDALGYTVTYHGPRYVVSSSDLRSRYGVFAFDTLAAENSAERARWAEARKETYRGSFRHFIDALKANAPQEEDFWIRLVPSSANTLRDVGAREKGRSGQPISNISDIVERSSPSETLVLSLSEDAHLQVRYTGKGEDSRFAREYRGRAPRSYQLSRIGIREGTKVLVDTRSGDFLRRTQPDFGYYVLTGYWGWYNTVATALPAHYRPPDAPESARP